MDTAEGQARIAAAEGQRNAYPDQDKPFSARIDRIAHDGAYSNGRRNGALNGWDHSTKWTQHDPCTIFMFVFLCFAFPVGGVLFGIGLYYAAGTPDDVGTPAWSIAVCVIGVVLVILATVFLIMLPYRMMNVNKQAAAAGYQPPDNQTDTMNREIDAQQV